VNKGDADSDVQLADAIDKTFATQKLVSEQLELLLNKRIATFRYQKTLGTTLTVASLFLAIVLVAFIGISIVKPIAKSRYRLELLARGDLVTPVDVVGQGELREMTESLKIAVDSMRQVVNPMRAGANDLSIAAEKQRKTSLELTSNAEETSTQAQVVSAAAEQVSANVRSVAAAAEEMDATIREIASQAHQAARVAADAVTLAQSTGGLVSKLGESGSRIGGVVKLITSIAEQTNLLSLNAAIEAEKAGEYGLGFSVIAREIRRLADQTAVATLDIERIVGEMQSSVSSGVMEMDRFGEQVRNGVSEATQLGEELTEIILSVEKLKPRFDSAHNGMQAQVLGASQINEAMLRLREAALGSEESAVNLDGNAQQLLQAVDALKLAVGRFTTA
jgi:methyl-accepting chemotaxis protein WspA